MGIFKGVVRIYGDEGAFLTALYGTLANAIGASRITSSSSLIPTVESIGNDTVTPYIEFIVDGIYKLRINRGNIVKKVTIDGENVIGGGATSYYTATVTHLVTNTALSSQISFSYVGIKQWYSDIVREWKVAVITSAKAIIVQLGAYNQVLVDYDAAMDVLLLIEGGINIFRAKKMANSTSSTTGWIAGTGENVSLCNRQAIIYDGDNSNHISIIRSKLFYNTSDSTKVLVTDSLFDVTNLGSISNRRVIIDGRTCYVLDTNTIMPVS